MRSENAVEGWLLTAVIPLLCLRNALTILWLLAADSKLRILGTINNQTTS